jgi:hypothetical protein
MMSSAKPLTLVLFLIAISAFAACGLGFWIEAQVWSEANAYACGVIAGQQMALGKWVEAEDCKAIRLDAVARGLTAMAEF